MTKHKYGREVTGRRAYVGCFCANANATLVWLDKETETAAIQDAIKKGSVLFTWCDSDARIRKHYGRRVGQNQQS
jgi:hypothetical protein